MEFSYFFSMRLHLKNILLSLVTLLVIACTTDNEYDVTAYQGLINGNTSYSEEALDLGVKNAVKKAYQLTDIVFTPLLPIAFNYGVFEAKQTYKGVIYSSVKELETFVGNDISIYTYMTAIHNPKSKIYTEDISQSPYHGINCKAYYGTVCSSFVSYALGIIPRYWANDFPLSNVMQEIDWSNLDNVKVADILWRDGHVAMITNIAKDKNGTISGIEISESIGEACKRYYRNREEFIEMMKTSFQKIFRYTEIYKNKEYTPIPEFVAVMDEEPISFQYNNDLCVDKGDKSCYREKEEVIVNIMHPYDFIEIYRNDELFKTIDIQSEDIKLDNLPYGDYKARIYYNGKYSDYTYWKVVNMNVEIDKVNQRIYFSSANATPQYIRYCDISGFDGYLNTSYRHILSEDEIKQGYINVLPYEIRSQYPYIHISFVTDYGTIINKPVSWFE